MDNPKDPEPISLDIDPEPIQSHALSLEERALFDDLFRALDCLVLERSAEGQAFRPIHTMPEWAHCVVTTDPNQPSQGLYVITSADLKDYMPRAISWWDQHEGGASESKLWEQDGPSEDDLDLEATATAIGQQKLLVIKRGAPSVRKYIQLIRDKRRNLHQLLPLS